MPRRLEHRALRGWVAPDAAFAHLLADEPYAFWIDAGPGAGAGWSFVGVGEVAPAGMDGFVADIRALRSDRPDVVPEWKAGPFPGGYVGWFGYESGAARAGAPVASGDPALGSAWMRVVRHLAFDHARRRVWAVARPEEIDEWTTQADAAAHASSPIPPGASASSVHARHSPQQYEEMIAQCRAAIREGDAYQLCLTTRFSVGAPVDPLAAFLRLRAASPSPRAAFVRFGDHALVSSTPERFLRVTGGIAATSPIKGTRPRGQDAASDDALARELATDPKERAENVMIVDLMRNDLSRVSVPGGIRVDRLLAVETYASVHQLVSDVSGRLAPGTTMGAILDAAFPAGSMTGAPKLSAMTLLHRIEAAPRGVFSGCVGWIGTDGAADLAMTIRSIVSHPGGAYVGAGGGITWRSRPAAEVAEVGIKARAPLAALGAPLPEGW